MRFPGILTDPVLPGLFYFLFLLLVPAARAQDKPGWKLIWSDEFTDPAINASQWSRKVGRAIGDSSEKLFPWRA